MKKSQQIFTTTALFLIVLLWVYAGISKLSDFYKFRMQMERQVLFAFLKPALVYLLPPLELGIGFSLAFDKTRTAGLYASFLLLSTFSVYIGLALFHLLGQVPCSCGGILEHMTWDVHLAFNLFYLALNLTTIYLTKKERSAVTLKTGE